MVLANGLTIKQNAFVTEFIENGGNGTQAALKTYDTVDPRTAAMMASDLLTKPNINSALEKMGITDAKLTKVIKSGLSAKRTISAQVIVKSDDPKVRNKQATARDIDFIDVPDHAVRHKYLETALKLKGHLRRDEPIIQNNIVMPILGGATVHSDNSNQESPQPPQED